MNIWHPSRCSLHRRERLSPLWGTEWILKLLCTPRFDSHYLNSLKQGFVPQRYPFRYSLHRYELGLRPPARDGTDVLDLRTFANKRAPFRCSLHRCELGFRPLRGTERILWLLCYPKISIPVFTPSVRKRLAPLRGTERIFWNFLAVSIEAPRFLKSWRRSFAPESIRPGMCSSGVNTAFVPPNERYGPGTLDLHLLFAFHLAKLLGDKDFLPLLQHELFGLQFSLWMNHPRANRLPNPTSLIPQLQLLNLLYGNPRSSLLFISLNSPKELGDVRFKKYLSQHALQQD